MSKPVRQITPPMTRIWFVGIVATVLATGLNYGWWWICGNIFSWELQVPKAFNSTDLISLSQNRVLISTAAAGLIATIGAHLLGKTVIGPRIWWLIISTAIGLASFYGVLTFTTLNLSIRISLAVMHGIAMLVIIPLLTKALTIDEVDVDNAVRKHNAYKDAQTAEAQLEVVPKVDISEVSTINPTVVIPQFDLATVLDKSADDAIATIELAGLEARIISRDGQMFPISRDFREDRVNLEIANDIVTNAHVG